jgi:hypothetical protein
LFEKPVAPEIAKPIAAALQKATGCDNCTKDIDHVWRIPGTWNRPNRKKIAEGRSPDPQPCRLHECIDTWEERITADALRAAILKAKPDAFDAATSAATGSDDTAFDWQQRVRPDDPRTTLSDAAILKALNKEGDRSKLACNFIVRLKRNNYSPEEIGETMASYSYTLVMGHYMEHPSGFTDALDADVKRIFSKPLVNKDTSKVFRVDDIRRDADDARPEYPPARTIEQKGGALPRHVDDAEAALIEQKAAVFQRGGMIVQPAALKVEVQDRREIGALVISPVNAAALVEHMTTAAVFLKWDGRSNDWKQVNCPREIADTLLARGDWKLRVLTAITDTPTMRPDGTILDRAGYDPATGILLDMRGVEYPQIPLHPARDDALQALACFDELISGYPFATREDRAVALSAFLTVVIRRMLRGAPFIGIDANGAGSGKSKLADAISTVGSGHPASSITAGANVEELDKRLHSLLLRGDLTICIDNVTDDIGSDFLCSALTQEWVDVRPLGTSRTAKAPTRCMFITTGNGLTYAGDLNRRTLTCSIDPKCEDPSARQFAFDPVERAREGRVRYVVAALTVLRAYQAAGRPAQKGKVMGGYGEWCRTVRDALLWLGEADPVSTCHPVSADDPTRERFAAVVSAWSAAIGTVEAVSVKQALTRAMSPGPESSALLDAFKAVAPSATLRGATDGVDVLRLGYWLRKQKGRVAGTFRFYPRDVGNSGRRWQLEDVSRAGGSDDELP